jgi:hypothetical protein
VILGLLDSLDYSENLIAVKAYDMFCSSTGCKVVLEGNSLYFDDDHFSVSVQKLWLKRYSKSDCGI